MSGRAKLSTFPIKLDGHQLDVIADPSKAGLPDEPGYNGEWAALTVGSDVQNGDVPVFLRHFTGGHGAIERRDESDDDRCAWAEDGFTHLAQGFMPSGRRVAVGQDLGLSKTDRAVVDSRLFNGHLWCITTAGTVIRFPNADPTQTPVHDPALNAFGSATASLRASYVCKAIEVFAKADGTAALYVSAYDGTNTRLYQYTVAAGWTESAVLGFRLDRLCVTWWEDSTGAGAARLVGQVDDITIRHIIAGSDPMTAANWVTPITMGNPGYPIQRLVAAPRAVFVRKTDGIWSFNGIRSFNLTSGWSNEASLTGSGPSIIWNDKVVSARGFGMDMYDANVQERQQRRNGECGPSYGIQDGSPIYGQVSALCTQNGPLYMALWNSDNLTSYVGRAYDRLLGNENGPAFGASEGIPNPLRHYWSEQTIKPTSGTGQQITHMTAVAPTVAGSTSIAARTVYLWMFTIDTPTNLGFHFNCYYAPLPTGSGPISMQASGNTGFTFNPTATLFMTAQNWNDRTAIKHILLYELATQGVSATKNVEIQARPDGDPTTILDLTTWKSEAVVTQDNAELVPNVATTGHLIGFKAILTTPPPYTSAPILRELSPRAKVARQVLDTRTLYIVLERDHRLSGGAIELRGPDTVYDAVSALQIAGPSPYYDEEGRVYSAVMDQGIHYTRARILGRGWRTVVRVILRLIAA
jgi:hypothetical protein